MRLASARVPEGLRQQVVEALLGWVADVGEAYIDGFLSSGRRGAIGSE
jgi:hypothetical protein